MIESPELSSKMNLVLNEGFHQDTPNHFWLGEVITGKLILSNYGNESINSICIEFRGEAKIYSRSFLCFCDGLKCQESLMQQELKFEDINEAGYKNQMNQYEIPFRFQVPDNIPGSMHESMCNIQYQIMAIDPENNQDHIDIFIHSNPNLPFYKLSELVWDSIEKNLECFFSKNLRIECQLPRSGYEVGTEVPIKCMIDNRSSKSMSLEVKLIQKIRLRTNLNGKNYKSHYRNLMKEFVTDIEPYCMIQHTKLLILPSIVPVVYNTSELIQITYCILVELRFPWNKKLQCKLPIILTSRLVDVNNNVI